MKELTIADCNLIIDALEREKLATPRSNWQRRNHAIQLHRTIRAMRRALIRKQNDE